MDKRNAGLIIVLISIANNNIPIPLNSFFITTSNDNSIYLHVYYSSLERTVKRKHHKTTK
jgi:hypothetical protein